MWYKKHAQEKPSIRPRQQKFTFHRPAYTNLPNLCTPATYTEAVHYQVLLGLPSLSLTTEGSWTLGEGSPSLSSAV